MMEETDRLKETLEVLGSELFAVTGGSWRVYQGGLDYDVYVISNGVGGTLTYAHMDEFIRYKDAHSLPSTVARNYETFQRGWAEHIGAQLEQAREMGLISF